MISNTSDLIETMFRQEYGHVLAALISRFEDISLAEDAVQDALLIALESWSVKGIPHNPGAWIMAIAKCRAIDRLRRDSAFARKRIILMEDETAQSIDREVEEMETIPDERLKLMFTCCHPSLAVDAQVALTLRTVCGLTADEIARAFLIPAATLAKRLIRAKTKIHEAGIPYRVPPAHLLPERLDSLLAVIYLIFTEGYCATRGDLLIRQELCNEAIRLTRLVVNLLPDDPLSADAHGLLALLLLHDSRRNARVSSLGELVLLEDQDRAIWDHRQIHEGLAMLEHALAMGNPGPYQVQAAISALHAQALAPEDTDWRQIVILYDILIVIASTPVIQVNRAVAVGMAEGPQTGLRALMVIEGIENYYPFHAARADFLRRSNQFEAAAAAYQQAVTLCENNLECAYLSKRQEEMVSNYGNEKQGLL